MLLLTGIGARCKPVFLLSSIFEILAPAPLVLYRKITELQGY